MGLIATASGDHESAHQAYDRAIAADHAEHSSRAWFNKGTLHQQRQETDAAVTAFRQAMAGGHQGTRAKAAVNLGFVLFGQAGDIDGARQAFHDAIATGEPDQIRLARQNLEVLDQYGPTGPEARSQPPLDDGVDVSVGRGAGSIKRQWIPVDSDDADQSPPNAALQESLEELIQASSAAEYHMARADQLAQASSATWRSMALPEYLGAHSQFHEVLVGAEQLYALHPTSDPVKLFLATTLNNLGLCAGKIDRIDDAVDHLGRAVELLRALASRMGPGVQTMHAETTQSWALALADAGRLEEAVEASREALTRWRAIVPQPPPVPLARALRAFGHIRAVAGVEFDEARNALDESMRILVNRERLHHMPLQQVSAELQLTTSVQHILHEARGGSTASQSRRPTTERPKSKPTPTEAEAKPGEPSKGSARRFWRWRH
jgi:tetratricopeptide (TPR) repeat protein